MRVAMWETDDDGTSERRRERQRLHVERAAADVVVLTGSGTSLVPPGHQAVVSETGTTTGVHDVVLTGRHLQPAPVAGPVAAAAAVVTVDRDWLVLGVRVTPSDVEPLERALVLLCDAHPGLPVVVAGSFGQTLQGHVVGSRVGRELLGGLLRRHGLTAWTAGTRSARAGCASVDHVCSTSEAATVRTWSSVDHEAELVLSDHLGYLVEL